MIKHIVMWKLKDSAHGFPKSKNALLIKEKLESLNGKIPGLLKLEVGIDFLQSPDSADIVLYSEFESREALQIYQDHPLHRAVMPFVAEARETRISVDYKI
ncbi:MAG: Dabb family protein [Bacteroidales bacterium]